MARGFTLIEVLLSVGIIGLLGALSMPVYMSLQSKTDLQVTSEHIAQSWRRAQRYSQASRYDDGWGVNVLAGTLTLFKGNSFAGRDSSYDESSELGSSLSFSGITEISFSQINGAPDTTGTLTLSSKNNEEITLSISDIGTVSY